MYKSFNYLHSLKMQSAPIMLVASTIFSMFKIFGIDGVTGVMLGMSIYACFFYFFKYTSALAIEYTSRVLKYSFNKNKIWQSKLALGIIQGAIVSLFSHQIVGIFRIEEEMVFFVASSTLAFMSLAGFAACYLKVNVSNFLNAAFCTVLSVMFLGVSFSGTNYADVVFSFFGLAGLLILFRPKET